MINRNPSSWIHEPSMDYSILYYGWKMSIQEPKNKLNGSFSIDFLRWGNNILTKESGDWYDTAYELNPMLPRDQPHLPRRLVLYRNQPDILGSINVLLDFL
jgi:hypothetical protein